MSENNLILQTDSYKVSHHLQYPPETKYVYSYFESRGGKYDSVLFFGLQYVIKKWLMGPVITEEKIQEVMKCRTWFWKATDTPITNGRPVNLLISSVKPSSTKTGVTPPLFQTLDFLNYD